MPYPAETVTTTGAFLLVLALVVPVVSVLARLRRRRAPRRTHRAGDHAARPGDRGRDRRHAAANGRPAGLSARRLGSAARGGAARGRTVGGHADDRGRRDRDRRRVRARRFPHARGVGRSARAVRVLDPAAGDLGRAQRRLPGGGSVHVVRRAGAPDLRRGAAGLPGRPRGDAPGRAALSAVRAARLRPLSRRHGAALWQLRHARHRPALPAGPGRARDPRRSRADDGGPARQDRALPVASLAAACPCRRAGRRQRGAVGAGGEGILLHRRAAVVRRDAGAARPCGRAAARRAGSGGDRVRQRGRAATAAAEAVDRLFDAGADRLPLPDVSARLQRRPRRNSRAAVRWPAVCCRRSPTPARRPPCSCRRD